MSNNFQHHQIGNRPKIIMTVGVTVIITHRREIMIVGMITAGIVAGTGTRFYTKLKRQINEAFCDPSLIIFEILKI